MINKLRLLSLNKKILILMLKVFYLHHLTCFGLYPLILNTSGSSSVECSNSTLSELTTSPVALAEFSTLRKPSRVKFSTDESLPDNTKVEFLDILLTP